MFSAFVDMGKCFLRFPYEQVVTLSNPTSIPARYELIPQDRSSSRPPAIQYDSPKSWVWPILVVFYLNSPLSRNLQSKKKRIDISSATKFESECVKNAKSEV